MNPINLIKNYLMKGLTPKGIVQQMGLNNPILNNVIDMAQKGNTKGVEEFARNMMKERRLGFR